MQVHKTIFEHGKGKKAESKSMQSKLLFVTGNQGFDPLG